jgi:preprotein translocase subunit SecA
VSDTVAAMRADMLARTIDAHIPAQSLEEQWDLPGLEVSLKEGFGGDWPIRQWLNADHTLHEETLRERIGATLAERYADNEKVVGSETMRQIEKAVMLQTLDTQWKDHLAAMDYLRQGIHLRGYAQKNPKQEFKREAFEMFSALLDSIKQEVVTTLCKLQIQTSAQLADLEAPPPPRAREFEFQHEEFHGFDQADEEDGAHQSQAAAGSEVETHQPFVRDGRKVGRNEPCPCGSGKKYKHCHGKAS